MISMVSESTIKQYPASELELFSANQELQNQLLSELNRVATEEEKSFIARFVTDGFYPYYTYQKLKILFVGKESLGIRGCDYIDVLMDGIKSNNPRDRGTSYSNNKDPFLSKMLYMAYGLNHGCCEYSEMPWASEIGTEQFAVEGGISFAFMNFSKFDNPSNSYSADIPRINKYCEMLERTGKNWYEEQMALLEPDLIITMNIGDWLTRMFKLDYWGLFDKQAYSLGINDIDLGYLPVKGKDIPLVNTWHFSASGKTFEKQYYLPVVRSIKEYFKFQLE